MPLAPIRVGLIGCGNVALGDHVPAYLSMPDRFRLVAIADPTPGRSSRARTSTSSTCARHRRTTTTS